MASESFVRVIVVQRASYVPVTVAVPAAPVNVADTDPAGMVVA
jgi:hypothetical protein